MLLAILSQLSSLAIAKDRDLAHEFQQIFEFSGVAAHLRNVNSNVQLEVEPLLEQCARKDKNKTFALLDAELSPAELNSRYIQGLTERISVTELDQIMHWIRSPAAGRIAEVDRLSGELTAEQFNALSAKFENSPDNSPQRAELISEVIKQTGAVYFLSAINTEITALVETASLCETHEEAVKDLLERLKKVRGDEGFYRALMRSDVILTSAVLYQDVSSEDLQALTTFSESEAGKSYHRALIQGVRSLLQNKNNDMQLQLFNIDQ